MKEKEAKQIIESEFGDLKKEDRSQWETLVSLLVKYGADESRPVEKLVSPAKGRTTAVFYNEDQTKNITFYFTEENDTWDIKIEFNPELNLKKKNNDLYQTLASYFMDIIKK